jgi:AdoMet-dependent rRNA methyltransferase SPB1
LDPNHVFKEVQDPGLQKVDVMHKKYDKLNKRHRTGYDETLGVLLSSKVTVTDFVYSKDPIRLLTDHNEIVFSAGCEDFALHPATSEEMRQCLSDLRVLAKLDFKKLLKWKDVMKASFPLVKGGEASATGPAQAKGDEEVDTDDELDQLTSSLDVAARREKKKLRQKAAKERQRQALGINNNAFSNAEDMELFSLSGSGVHKSSDLNAVHDVDLDDETDGNDQNKSTLLDYYRELDKAQEPQLYPAVFVEASDGNLEVELEEQYKRFVTGKRLANEQSLSEEDLLRKDQKEEATLEGRSSSAKSARLSRKPVAILARKHEQDMGQGGLSEELSMYVDILSGKNASTKNPSKKRGRDSAPQISSDSDSSDDDVEHDHEGSDDDDIPVASHSTRNSGAAGSAKWFAHPIFSESLLTNDSRMSAAASAAIASMPTTDKAKRKEQRKKSADRATRREQRREDANQSSADNLNFDVAPRLGVGNDLGDDDADTEHLSAEVLQHRALIKRGMGSVVQDNAGGATKKRKLSSAGADADAAVEVVAREEVFAGADDRSYDSDNEEYDSHDRAMTLALGTLMLRRSKQKALVDASYNRFAWNDAKGLPPWFVDDEMKHNKPQLPVPEALMNQIKSRFQLTGTKEIKKVAEARARKKKRAMTKLKAAKKQASMMAENSEMSEKQKLKAISKAMRTSKTDKPGKVYVVAHSAGSVGTSSGNKGKLKFVDKRMKKDARSMKRKEKASKKRRK